MMLAGLLLVALGFSSPVSSSRHHPEGPNHHEGHEYPEGPGDGSVVNSTYYNPIFPGFHPDPSCVFVPEWDDTYFCAASSFNAFPGLPIHASKDMRDWRLIGYGLNRPEQLPRLAETNRSTSGIWAPTLRYENGKFWIFTTLVDDEKPQDDASRWDNIIFSAKDPFDPLSWSEAVHFEFEGYDPSPFWEDGKVYVTGAHAWRVLPGIHQTEIDLETGEVGEWEVIWEGTGGQAPEGPHIYHKDGYYYLLVAEGGTGNEHMVTISRSESLWGPFEANPANPILTNTNTTSLFQAVGHADLFQDKSGNWWCVALSVRGGSVYLNFPMGRETVMAPARWEEGEWPFVDHVKGTMEGWPMPERNTDVEGIGRWVSDREDDITFAAGSSLPPHFQHWRYPNPDYFEISPEGHPDTLRINPSKINLTALNGNYAGPGGHAFVGRKQQDTLFTYSINLDFAPEVEGEEAGVTAFLTQNHHVDLGVVMLPAGSQTAAFPGEAADEERDSEEAGGALKPHFRFRAESYVPVPDTLVVPVPAAWVGETLRLEISAKNFTHYSFSGGPAARRSEARTLMDVSNELLSWGFTGAILGTYATTNGGEGSAPAYISEWKYIPQEQFRD
ncbi:related to beta-xylosidase [Cephalotrichum gorgonifer]|uniref:Related to beta-xylosidase n=1 Tax=Cephalotrichum gorgonifer TaxID=2041049 RepID=A0AAE8SSR3_9PEZI|nr:related to beta-xylosidase [Cephalotrichum gorgonifer]